MILLKPVMNVVGECKNNFHIIKSIEHKEEFLDLYGQFGVLIWARNMKLSQSVLGRASSDY